MVLLVDLLFTLLLARGVLTFVLLTVVRLVAFGRFVTEVLRLTVFVRGADLISFRFPTDLEAVLTSFRLPTDREADLTSFRVLTDLLTLLPSFLFPTDLDTFLPSFRFTTDLDAVLLLTEEVDFRFISEDLLFLRSGVLALSMVLAVLALSVREAVRPLTVVLLERTPLLEFLKLPSFLLYPLSLRPLLFLATTRLSFRYTRSLSAL